MKRMIIAGLAAIVLSAGLSACKEEAHQLKSEESIVAEAGARDYADRSQSKFIGCSGQDSPPVDGYVTCSIAALAAPHAETELVCGYKGRGCKRK